jgi:hypothetical protein
MGASLGESSEGEELHPKVGAARPSFVGRGKEAGTGCPGLYGRDFPDVLCLKDFSHREAERQRNRGESLCCSASLLLCVI